MENIITIIESYVFIYPVVMSLIWITGGILHYIYKRQKTLFSEPPVLLREPLVSVLIPAHNEHENVLETVQHVLDSDYKNIEVIVINDASVDDTRNIVYKLCQENDCVRLLDLAHNSGKAAALNYAFWASNGEIILTIDADCQIDKSAINWIVNCFEGNHNLGAVTGNPRVKNTGSFFAKLQAIEYTSVIGLIKRTQHLLGTIFTISGAIAAFRREAIQEAGLWSENMLTEDIDISWKIEKKKWDIQYEERAKGWIFVPTTLRGLIKQRKRWCTGGAEVLRKHRDVWKTFHQRWMWTIYADYVLSIVWAYSYTICLILWVASLLDSSLVVSNPIVFWKGSILLIMCLFQFAVSVWLDKVYEQKSNNLYYYVIWYPILYWFIQTFLVVICTPVGLLKNTDKTIKWDSPDRGAQIIGGAYHEK